LGGWLVDVLELFMQFLLFLHVVPPPVWFSFIWAERTMSMR
jgi:hypothetical protein